MPYNPERFGADPTEIEPVTITSIKDNLTPEQVKENEEHAAFIKKHSAPDPSE